MIPKMGMRPVARELNLQNYYPVFIGEELMNGVDCFVIKLIPEKKNSKVVLATLWIDVIHQRAARWELFTKKAGNMSKYSYT